MPSYTFNSTANCICLRGAKPVFLGISRSTLNINSEKIESAINKNTTANYVHYASVVCDMDKIKHITNKHKLYLVEDAAQAIGSKYNDKFSGSFGDISVFSFHETKILAVVKEGL